MLSKIQKEISLDSVLMTTVDCSAQGWDNIVQPLTHFAFMLMDTTITRMGKCDGEDRRKSERRQREEDRRGGERRRHMRERREETGKEKEERESREGETGIDFSFCLLPEDPASPKIVHLGYQLLLRLFKLHKIVRTGKFFIFFLFLFLCFAEFIL